MINAFLMMGQSNMSGRGALDELPPLESRHVLAFRDGEWEVAVEPVVRDRPFSSEGMGTSFGTTLHALTGADIGLIPCSLGGSPLDMWLPGQELYETALQSAISAMQSGARIAGVLWHQGEADSEHACGAHSYMQRFEPMLERLRAQTASGSAAFHLLPERFTLTELQQVHEVLLGRPLLKAAFRRKIAPLVQETDQMTQNAGHRPSRLYRRKQEDRT